MKTKLLCMLFVTAYAFTTLLICASCENPWMAEILDMKTITFDSNGGSYVSSQDLMKGKKVKRPANPSKSEYTFDAWYIDNETFETPWNFNTVPTYGFTLYAKWNFSGNAGTAGLEYALINNDTAYRVSRGTATGNIVIPAYHRENADSPYLPVTEIGNGTDTMSNNAFGQTSNDSPNTTVTGITFAAGSQLTAISHYAFQGCHSLTRITLPASVKSIGDSAFGDCSELTAIAIPAGVESIGNSAFNNCVKLTGITLPAGITSISQGTFAFCSELTSITIPANVTSIGRTAFNECGKLTSITIGAGVTSIAGDAFNGCTSLKNIIIDNDVYVTTTGNNWGNIFLADDLSVTFRKNVGGAAFHGCYKLTSVTIAAGVTSIGQQAFINCTGLTSVTIAEGVTSIGEQAFDSCTNLTSITIPASVTFIGDHAFNYWVISQTINIRGHASSQSANDAWGAYWRASCNATIKYWNGSSYQ